MRNHLERRLEELKAEFVSGQKMQAELEAKQTTLKETLLRISGAIQVLEEELAREEDLVEATTLYADGDIQHSGNMTGH